MNTIPILQFTDNSICLYQEILNRGLRSERQKDNEKNLSDVTYNGYMSPKTKSKVRKYLSVWLNGLQQNAQIYKKRYKNKSITPTFVTLTLPGKQMHTDNQLKRELLNRFIIYLRKHYLVKHYYWRAEPQKNGNIHFHLIIDRYVNYIELRDYWNNCLDKLGYLVAYSNRMTLLSLNAYWQLVKGYKNADFDKSKAYYLREKKSGWLNPNSTDIHKLDNIKSLSSYVIKYMTKTDSSRKIKGRIHGGSDGLRDLRAYSTPMSQAEYSIEAELWGEKGVRRKEGEFHTVWYLDTFKWLKAKFPKVFYEIQSYYTDEFQYLYEIKKKASLKLKEQIAEKLLNPKPTKKYYRPSQKEMFLA